MNVSEFLEQRSVKYELIRHQPTYDAQHLAEKVHESGKNVAKTVLLRCDKDEYVIAVLPASRQIDLDRAKQLLGNDNVELATEIEMKEQCEDCEIGALPPFGKQYSMKTILDSGLAKAGQIVFEGNRHNEAIRMQYSDFERLESPQVGEFAVAAD